MSSTACDNDWVIAARVWKPKHKRIIFRVTNTFKKTYPPTTWLFVQRGSFFRADNVTYQETLEFGLYDIGGIGFWLFRLIFSIKQINFYLTHSFPIPTRLFQQLIE